MNIPFLTACIASSYEDENQNEYGSIIKKISNIKDGDNHFVAYLVFNTDEDNIYFKLQEPYTEESCYKYYYFGNNSGATGQFYMTRDIKSLNYLLQSSFSDLYGYIDKYNMRQCELSKLLRLLEEKNLIIINKAKGEGRVNLSKFKGYEGKEIVLEKKDFIINGEKINFDNFVRKFIDNYNRKNKFVMIVPIIVKDRNEIIISRHKDYLELIKVALKLESNNIIEEGKENVCYICGKKKTDVNSKYSAKFGRVNINKIFTTTTKNYSQINKNLNYDNNYAFCQSCYKKLGLGANIINQKFIGRLAGESAFILPEGITNSFKYEKIYQLKERVDLVFNGSEADNFIKITEDSSKFDNIDLYSINFIVYRSDGKSINVIQSIEDVPTLRIKKIIKFLSDNSIEFGDKVNIMYISDIYRIIPVREDKKGNQINIGRVLSLYKSLLCSEVIDSEIIYLYADEAIEKGCRELDKKTISNYRNMNLQYYKQNDFKDYFIRNIITKYIALLKTLQKLKLLNKEVFSGEEKNEMSTTSFASDDINKSINKIEKFLYSQEFSSEAKALFYLGILVNRVAYKQWDGGHKNKPVLKKIQFQGMKYSEICRLYNDVIDKLNQYNAFNLFLEACMNKFHFYSGALDKKWTLSDQANVFYIMAGYSYMIGNAGEKKINSNVNEEE